MELEAQELKKLKSTSESQKLKTWNLLKPGSYFYCSGTDKESGDEYQYISKIIQGSDDGWEADDIWDSREYVEGGWHADKNIFMTHRVFVIINPSEYPEYWL